jgi:hypothetical protein
MKVTRRIEIVTVREQTFRAPATSAVVWCAGCGNTSHMITPNLAATLSGLNLRTLFRWIESGDIHFVETPEGNVLLCLNSVKAKAFPTESEVVFSHGSCTSTANKRTGS